MFLFNKKRYITNDEEILIYLHKLIPKSKIIGKSVYLLKHDLTIKPKIKKLDKGGFIKVIFSIKHELFEEVLTESSIGVGETINEAIHKCVENFITGSFYSIINCITGNYSEDFETKFCGKKNKWKVFLSPIQGTYDYKDKNNIKIWEEIEDKIKDRLGNKKFYIINIYAARLSNGEINSTCRINGLYNSEISEYVLRYINQWNGHSEILSLNQYFVIMQDKETYNQYEFSEDDIKYFTKMAINVLGNSNTNENTTNYIYKIVGNDNLAYEIRKFIPEILCELVFCNIGYSDKVVIVKENERIEYYKNQFTSYYWIYKEVSNDYYNSRISEEQIKTIILQSTAYEAISKALNSGRKIHDLKNIEITLHPPKDFIVL